MRKNGLKASILLLLLAAGNLSIQAQQGFGTNNPDASAVIDMTSTNKGVLFPRVALKSTTEKGPIVSPTDYMVVFNINTEGDVTPGLYYWKTSAWVRLLSSAGSVGINTNTPNGCAVLDVSSTTQGLLPPRMTSAQMAAITNPAPGLMVYNTDQQCLMSYGNGTFRCINIDRAAAITNDGTVVANNAAPTLSVLTNSVTQPYVGSIASVTSVYSDDFDAPGTTTYQWYRYSDMTGSGKIAIANATTVNYTLAAADLGFYVQVEATAHALSGTSPGLVQRASSYLGPVVDKTSCGTDLRITHLAAGGVAPIDKTVTYGTVSYNGKCWITQNLGASKKAASYIDTNSDVRGWLWQYGNKQGYSVSGTTITPTVDHLLAEAALPTSSNWSAALDPCTLLLGGTWRLPTIAEYASLLTNVPSINKSTANPPFFYQDQLLYNGALYESMAMTLYSSSKGSTSTNPDRVSTLIIGSGTGFETSNVGIGSWGAPLRCLK
jgi:hypothetical protein